jgi:hypothetical protein
MVHAFEMAEAVGQLRRVVGDDGLHSGESRMLMPPAGHGD